MAYITDYYFDPNTGVYTIDGTVFTNITRFQKVQAADGSTVNIFQGLEQGGNFFRVYIDEFPNDDQVGLKALSAASASQPAATYLPDGSLAIVYAQTFTNNSQTFARLFVDGQAPIAQLYPSGITLSSQTFNGSQPATITADGAGNLLVVAGTNFTGGPAQFVGWTFNPFGASQSVIQRPMTTPAVQKGRNETGFLDVFVDTNGSNRDLKMNILSQAGAIENTVTIASFFGVPSIGSLDVMERQDGTFAVFAQVNTQPTLYLFEIDDFGQLNMLGSFTNAFGAPQPSAPEYAMIEDENGDIRVIYNSFAGTVVLFNPADDPNSFVLETLLSSGLTGGPATDLTAHDLFGVDRGFTVTFGNGTGSHTMVYGSGAPVNEVSYVQLGTQTTYTGGSGTDIVLGTDGDDTIIGEFGDDQLRGGDGADLLIGDGYSFGTLTSTEDTIWGGNGNDLIYMDNPIKYDESFATAVEVGLSLDVGYGGAGKDTLSNQAGFSNLYGNSGDDVLIGGIYEDRLFGGTEDDMLYGNERDDTLDGGSGQDLLSGNRGDDFLKGGADNDILKGGLGNDLLRGNSGDDLMRGGAGEDTLQGQQGADTLDGGMGNDMLNGGNGSDVFLFRGDGEVDEVDVINDFRSGSDTIKIAGATGVTSFSDVSITQNGVLAEITVGNRTIEVVLIGSPLGSGDFDFA
ncbi:MAG: calcium-binding protein [Pseudomonadota bacterium]